MVVLIIIGIIVSSIVLSINTDRLEEHMEIEMNRLHALVNLAREEAILQGEDMALAINEEGYRFERYDMEKQIWLPLEDAQVFRQRSIPIGTEMILVIEDLPVEKDDANPGLSTTEQDEDIEDQNVQRVFIFPSGEIFPFELILRREDATAEFRLVATEDGELTIKLPEEIG